MPENHDELKLEFAAYLQGKLGEDESRKLENALRESAELEAEFEEFKNTWARLGEAASVPNLGGRRFTMRVIEEALADKAHRHSPRMKFQTLLKIAAVALILVTGGYLLTAYFGGGKENGEIAASLPPETLDDALLEDLDILVSDVAIDTLLDLESETETGYRLYENLGEVIETQATVNTADSANDGEGAGGD